MEGREGKGKERVRLTAGRDAGKIEGKRRGVLRLSSGAKARSWEEISRKLRQ